MIMAVPECYASTANDWRGWLRGNHHKEKMVYLIKYKKHTGKPSLNNREAMDEAICFGWIDTTVKRLDGDRYRQCFVKRNENCRWSRNTLRYAKELIKRKKMTKAGMEMYLLGLRRPVIDHGLPKNPNVPADFARELLKHHQAKVYFEKLAPSYRRYSIYWIERAKRPETRKKRIDAAVQMLLVGKKPGSTA